MVGKIIVFHEQFANFYLNVIFYRQQVRIFGLPYIVSGIKVKIRIIVTVLSKIVQTNTNKKVLLRGTKF